MPGKQESVLNRLRDICSHRVKILAKTEVYMCVCVYTHTHIYIYIKPPRKEDAVFLYMSELRNRP